MKKILYLLAMLIVLGVGCSDSYIGFYYEEPAFLHTYEQSPELKTLEECRNWIEQKSVQMNQVVGEYDSECGLNCKYDSDWEAYICEETY